MVVLMLGSDTITALVAGAVGIVLVILAILALDRLKPPALRREFTVVLPVEQAWQHLARVEEWPSWAKHIKQVELRPLGELGLGELGPGELGPEAMGRLHLNNGVKAGWPGSTATFTVTEFNPYHNWKWVAGF